MPFVCERYGSKGYARGAIDMIMEWAGLHNRGFVIADFIEDDNEWQRNVKQTKIIECLVWLNTGKRGGGSLPVLLWFPGGGAVN